jgi:hypothetical protein
MISGRFQTVASVLTSQSCRFHREKVIIKVAVNPEFSEIQESHFWSKKLDFHAITENPRY